jgi:hypothetical protein
MALVLIKTITVYSYSAIAFIGLLTNSLSFYIFSRKRFKNTIFSSYFRFYLVFQTLNLIFPINKIFEMNHASFFSNISNFTCGFRFFFVYVNFAIAAWFLVIISFDRYLSICYPTKYLMRKKTIFQIVVSFILIGFNICFYIPFWFYYIKESVYISTNQTKIISLRCSSPGIWLEFMDLFQQILIPFFFMILFSLLTAKNVIQSRKINCSTNSKTAINDRKFAISSITINILFLIFNLPHILLKIINQYSYLYMNDLNLLRAIQSFSYFFVFLNLDSTFFINYWVNSMFKNEFYLILFKGKKDRLKQTEDGNVTR